MLQSLKQKVAYGLQTTDAHIGTVKDFLIDDQTWAVRYMSLDTSKWLPLSRKVLISPVSFKQFDDEHELLHVDLSSEQVKQSPSIDEHKPVSREYEELLFNYFGYGFYWTGPGVWGNFNTPNQLVEDIDPQLIDQDADQDMPHNHLRSFEELLDYKFDCNGQVMGHVKDFYLNDETWQVESVLIDSSGWLSSGHKYIVPVETISKIDWSGKSINCTLTVEQLQNCEVL